MQLRRTVTTALWGIFLLLVFSAAPTPPVSAQNQEPAIGKLWRETGGYCTYFVVKSVPYDGQFVNLFLSAGHCYRSKMWVEDIYGNRYWTQVLLVVRPENRDRDAGFNVLLGIWPDDVTVGFFRTPHPILPLELTFLQPTWKFWQKLSVVIIGYGSERAQVLGQVWQISVAQQDSFEVRGALKVAFRVRQ